MTDLHASPSVDCGSNEAALASAKCIVDSIDAEFALVSIVPQGCGRCHEPGGCGGQNLTQALSQKKSYRVLNDIQAQVGDRVVVMTSPGAIRQAALHAYVLPLLFCVFFALLGQTVIGQSDVSALIGAGFGLMIGWLNLKRQKVKQLSSSTGNLPNTPHFSIHFDHSS